jgi:hypothetical protein
MEEVLKCHLCGCDTDYICEDCEEPVCESCTTPYTIHNQIEYCQCKSCGEGFEAARSLEYWEREDAEKARRKKMDERNAKARKRYNSPEQVEKRRLKKIELLKKRQEQRLKSLESIGKILSDFNRFF